MSENPCQSPQAACEPEGVVDRSITDHDLRLLRWSLLGFGLFGFITPLVLASKTGRVNLDIVAFFIGATGATLNRRSFVTFPWTTVLCLLYPLVFLAGCSSPDVLDYRYWLIPTRGSDLPHLFYLILAGWACANIVLIRRFHRIQKLGGRRGRPWQYSLRSLLGLTVLIALLLGLGTWYYRWSQPPQWAATDALEQRYAKQLSRLADDAYDYNRSTTGNRRNRKELQEVFGAEEIVDAYLWTRSPSGGESRVGMKLADVPSGMPSGSCLWVRNPRIGRPIVNLWSGRYVEYQALLKDKNGVERGYTLIVDLSKMSEGAEQ